MTFLGDDRSSARDEGDVGKSFHLNNCSKRDVIPNGAHQQCRCAIFREHLHTSPLRSGLPPTRTLEKRNKDASGVYAVPKASCRSQEAKYGSGSLQGVLLRRRGIRSPPNHSDPRPIQTGRRGGHRSVGREGLHGAGLPHEDTERASRLRTGPVLALHRRGDHRV